MKAIKNILLVLNCEGLASKTAIRYCHLISDAMGAEVTVIDVIKPAPNRWSLLVQSRLGVDVETEFAEEHMGEMNKFLASRNVSWPVVIKHGTALIEISRYVKENEIDLVVVPQIEDDGNMFGSLAKHLVRKCPSSVLLVKPSRKGQLKKVLVAIDPEVDFEEQNELNKKVLSLSHQLSSLLGGSLTIVAAWSIFAESYLRGPRVGVSDEEFKKLEKDEKEIRSNSLNKLSKSVGLKFDQKQIKLIKDTPDIAVLHEVAKSKSPLLVMGSVGRAGVLGALIGNTAERIIDTVDCSVLTVKPPGYVSPLKLS